MSKNKLYSTDIEETVVEELTNPADFKLDFMQIVHANELTEYALHWKEHGATDFTTSKSIPTLKRFAREWWGTGMKWRKHAPTES